jgi:hypothetical protein
MPRMNFSAEERARRAERARQRSFRHGWRHAPEYTVWTNIKQRCLNPQSQAWADYGGRGIRICEEWARDFSSFINHVGPRPSPLHEIDRIDNNGHYEPGNVRWSLRSPNCRNRRSTRYVTLDGERLSLVEAAERRGIPYSTVKSRLYLGWSEHDALHTPKSR